MILLLAANLGEISCGFVGLATLISGRLVMNTSMTRSGSWTFQRPFAAVALSLCQSLSLPRGRQSIAWRFGALFLFGSSALLPPPGIRLWAICLDAHYPRVMIVACGRPRNCSVVVILVSSSPRSGPIESNVGR
jgi:hypothetical protein